MSIRRNSVWNVTEVIVTAVVQLLIYKLIIGQMSIAALGVWSLVFSALSFARIADVGIAATLVRFIARPESENVGVSRFAFVETAFLINFGLFVFLGAIVYLPAHWALGLALNGALLDDAHALLPYAVVCFVLLNLSNVVLSALVGNGRADLKSAVSIVSLFLQLAVSLFVVRRFGLIGLALALIAQNMFVITAGWIVAEVIQEGRWHIRLPWRINRLAFIEMFSFGLKLQALNIANFLYDPLTKFVFSIVAGPAALGLYEASYRVVVQARALIIAPTQNLTPMFATNGSQNVEGLERLYTRSVALVSIAAALGLSLLVLASPVLSLVLLGRIQSSYILWVAILSAGWFLNIASSPAYLMGIGTGRVRWNIVGSGAASLAAILLGWLAGRYFGGVGVVCAAAFSTAGGGLITAAATCRQLGIARYYPSGAALWQALTSLPDELRAFR